MDIDKNKLLIADAFFKGNLDRLVEWSVGDIRKCCRMKEDGSCEEGGAMVGAFILWICAIEYLGGLLTGNTEPDGTNNRITEFVSRYLRGYNPAFITELRWSLLHYYSPHYFALMHENNILEARKIHLKKAPATKNQYILHLGCCIVDLEKAANVFKKDFWENEEIRLVAYSFCETHLPIMPIKFVSLFLSDSLINSNPSIVRIDVPVSGTTNKW